jgi:hypothetical protein
MMLSAEVRWFWEGQCPPQVHEWFHRSGAAPGGGKAGRKDRYFLQPGNAELGIKVRAEGTGVAGEVEIKGLVEVLPAPRRVEIWCKWKSSFVPEGRAVVIEKQRWLRKFAASPDIEEIPLGQDEQPLGARTRPEAGCNMELTEVSIPGRAPRWCTLGFEAFGDLATARRALTDTMEAVNLPPFEGSEMSYPEWLDRMDPVLRAAAPA